MVDAHHESATQAHESDNWLQPAAVGPEIHDTNFGLRWSVGSLDGGFEGDSLLEKVEAAVGDGDGVQVFVGWGELNSFACKGIERFEQEVLASRRKAFEVPLGEPVVEEDGFWNGGVVQIWKRKFADAEVPVRVAGPLDFEGVAVVEGELKVFALEFVHDRSVVDTMDGDGSSLTGAFSLIEKAVTPFLELRDIDRGDV
jgi:hypothetical protein